jgi:uncharacterized membrane-anchored protein
MNKILISLLVPILALAGWTVMLQSHAVSGKAVRIRIKGYDPRDLLSGHYIRFALDTGELDPCKDRAVNPEGLDACVCLQPDFDHIHHLIVSSHACFDVSTYCGIYLRGQCSQGRFTAGVERYSIPEQFAPVLQTIPENSSAEIAIDSSGNGQVLKVLVENEPIEEFAAKLQYQKPVAAVP